MIRRNSSTRPARRGARLAAVSVSLALAAGGLAAAPAIAAVGAEVDECDVPWMDTALTPTERTDALLDASSQHQKYRWLSEHPANSPEATTFSGVEYPEQVPCTPKVTYANGAEGVHRSAGTTAWPAPISVAASWNLELAEDKAVFHGGESFDNGNAVILGPGIASGRHPLSGRTPEYFGEDALLSGLMGAANVRGLEHGDPEKPIVANVKHFVANEQELDRDASSSNLDERTLAQTYMLPYEIAIAESDPGSLMCSYNQVNSIYACENPDVLGPLTDRMGFTGYVMSDFGSVHSTAASLNAGMDQELNRPIWYTPERLDDALAAGEITQERIDEAAFNVVHAYISRGLFDHPVPSERPDNLSTPEAKQAARELAEQGTVLLKNDDVLPIGGAPTVAVIGQTASSAEVASGANAADVCSASFRGSGVLDCSALVDPLTAIGDWIEGEGGDVVYDDGTDLGSAAATAASADIAIVFGYLHMGEFADIEDINLDNGGDALFEAVAGAADTTVAVVNSGTALEMPWIDDIDALLYGWYGGEQFGPALAALLSGEATPSGKLPMSLPVSLGDTPAGGDDARYPGIFSDGSTERPAGTDEIRQVDYAEGLAVGYKWYQQEGIAPLYEFGYGLSYTEFEYGDLEVERSGTADVTASFTVTNTGDVAGAEVAQAYLTLPESADEPGSRLVAFERVALEPGETATVSVDIDEQSSHRPWSIWDVDSASWTTPEGVFTLGVGGSSSDVALVADVVIDSSAPVIELSLDQRQRVVVDVASSTDVAVEYRTEKNGKQTAWTAYTGPFQIDARSSITVRATDSSGNVEEVTVESRKDLR